jgi:hypothetical protein
LNKITFILACQRQQISAATVNEASDYAGLAVISADPGFTAIAGGITAPFRVRQAVQPINQGLVRRTISTADSGL